MRYTDVLFDLYGTLVDIHTEENAPTWEKTALFYGFYGAPYTAAELEAAYKKLVTSGEAAAGQSYECYPELQIERIFARLFRQKGVEENADDLGVQAAQLFRISSIDYVRLYPGVAEALDALRAAGCRVWLLSNAQAVFTGYELRALGLPRHFDGIYLSSDYACRKPDTRFFDAPLRQHGLTPGHCLMVGNDRSSDIAGALACGMDCVYLHTNLSPLEDAPAAVDGRPLGECEAGLPRPTEATKATAARPAATYGFTGADWTVLGPRLVKLAQG